MNVNSVCDASASSQSGQIAVECDGEVATVTISNPGKRNCLTVAMWEALQECFSRMAGDEALRCVVMRGAAGEGFAAGADISEFEKVRSTHAQVEHFHEEVVYGALRAIDNCPVPVVAAIEGACVGGGLEIASVCDLRIVGRGARFGAPVHILGFPLAPAEMQYVFRLAGPAVTAELVFDGLILGAEDALAKSLVTRVVDDGAADVAALDCARRIAAGAPLAVRASKRHLRHLMSGQSFTREQRLTAYAFADTEDYDTGIRAFRDKVTPKFKGR